MHEHHHHARAYAFSATCCCGAPAHDLGCGCNEPGPFAHRGGGCCDTGTEIRFHRRFVSREEKIVRLEAYLADLQAEAQAAQERLTRLHQSEQASPV